MLCVFVMFFVEGRQKKVKQKKQKKEEKKKKKHHIQDKCLFYNLLKMFIKHHYLEVNDKHIKFICLT